MLAWQRICSRVVWLSTRSRLLSHRMGFNNLTSAGAAAKQLPMSVHHMRIGGQHAIHHIQTHAITPCIVNQVDGISPVSSMPDTIVSSETNIRSWNLAIKTYGRTESWTKALHLFERMQQEAMMPERFTFTSVLYACNNDGLLDEGKKIHARIARSELGSDPIIHTALVNMYGKHRSLDSAMVAFEQMTHRDVVAWSTLITVTSEHGIGLKAIQYWSQMLQEGVTPDNIAVLCILDAYIYASKRERTFILVCVLFSTQEDNEAVNTALMSVLGKCDNIPLAMVVFDKMQQRNVLTWSAMISIQVQQARSMSALQLFNDMQEQGTLPNEITFVSVASACANKECLSAGLQLHAQLVGGGQEFGPILGNSLLNMYNKCGRSEDAASLFHSLSKVDVITFTAMITASVKDGNADRAFGYLNTMISIGHLPDQVMINTLLAAGAMVSDPARVQCLHSFIVECGWDSELIMSNSLLSAYCKPGNLIEARWIFHRMLVHDSISWNAILQLYAQLEDSQEVLQVFHQMQQEMFFDKVTILNILGCFNGPGVLVHGKRLHTLLLAERHKVEVNLSTALVSMYGRCGSLRLAKRVFGETQDMDLILWRELVVAYSSNGQGSVVKFLFDRLLAECHFPDQLCFATLFSNLCEQVSVLNVRHLHVHLRSTFFYSDVSVNNALMSSYGKCGGLKDVHTLFYKMQRDSVSWNTLLSVCNLHAKSDKTKYLQEKMCWEGYLPDPITWTCCLAACANSIDLAEGKRVHARLRHYALDSDGFVGTSLLNMYGKCGNLIEARRIFDNLANRNLVSWNAMIAVYAQHGLGKAAANLFSLMLLEKVSPDEATFASALAACSHAGLIAEGYCILVHMVNCGFTPSIDDISCVIDLLGRLGRLGDAESLINAQPENATVNSVRALLSACRHQKDVTRGERVAEKVMDIDSNSAAVYVLLSNLYAHDDASC